MKLTITFLTFLLAACGGGGMPGNSVSTEFRTDRGIVIYPSPVAADLPELIHIELDKHNSRAVRAGLQPLDPRTLVVEIVPEDTNCPKGAFVTGGICTAGEFIPPTYNRRERVKVTAEGLRIPGYEGLQNEFQHQTYWRQDREMFEKTRNHPPPHPIGAFPIS